MSPRHKQAIGVRNGFLLARTVTNMNAFTPGSRGRVKVRALNVLGESPAREVVEHEVS